MDGGRHHSLGRRLTAGCLGLATALAATQARGAESSGTEQSDLLPQRYMREAEQFHEEVDGHLKRWRGTTKDLEDRRKKDEVQYRECQSRGPTAERQRKALEEQMRLAEAENKIIWESKFPTVQRIRQHAERERIALEDRYFRRARGDDYTRGLKTYRDRFAEYHRRYFAEIAPFFEAYRTATDTYSASMMKKCSDISDHELIQVLRDGYEAIKVALGVFKKR